LALGFLQKSGGVAALTLGDAARTGGVEGLLGLLAGFSGAVGEKSGGVAALTLGVAARTGGGEGFFCLFAGFSGGVGGKSGGVAALTLGEVASTGGGEGFLGLFVGFTFGVGVNGGGVLGSAFMLKQKGGLFEPPLLLLSRIGVAILFLWILLLWIFLLCDAALEAGLQIFVNGLCLGCPAFGGFANRVVVG
jgi:hypothetical protein